MAADIQKIIENVVEMVKKDPAILEKLEKNPVKVVEQLTGLDLPDEQVNKVITAVKAKVGADKLAGAASLLGKLF